MLIFKKFNHVMRQLSVGLLLTFVMAISAAAAYAAETQEVRYYKANQDTLGYLATPTQKGKRPAVILIHEWWGLNDQIRAKAREFAAEGYVVLAVDLYGGQSTAEPSKARELAGAVRGDTAAAFANLEAALDYLRQRDDVDGARLASVGWCFGGGWSYQIAKNNLGTRASVIYYGRFNPADDLAQMRATIMGHFAENDRSIKLDDVRQFQATLKGLSGEHEIFIYPNTGHGFANPENKRVYSKNAAAQADKRTLDFLQKHL